MQMKNLRDTLKYFSFSNVKIFYIILYRDYFNGAHQVTSKGDIILSQLWNKNSVMNIADHWKDAREQLIVCSPL